MIGIYKFDLDDRTATEQATRTEIEVLFDVDVSWDKNTNDIEYGTPSPTVFGVYIGGKILIDDQPFSDLAPAVQGFILAKLARLDMADLGINETEAMEEIAENDPIGSAVD